MPLATRDHAPLKPRLLLLLIPAALVAWFFWPALLGRQTFAFRDAAHFYYPLFQYQRQEWAAGRVPLWNPYENVGVPLVAENTTSVFYPGKLLFALPLDYTLLFNAYIILHVVLAAGTCYLLARRWQAGRLGALLAAIAYGFSGDVLFQTCNVVFLIGAAWLPVALYCADRMLRERSLGASLGLGAVLALIVLAGDPQMAANAVLLTLLLTALVWRDETREQREESPRRDLWRKRPLLIACALVTAGALAAVQIWPTLEASPHSGRARYDAPRNVYELARSTVDSNGLDSERSWYDGILGRHPRGHERHIYLFSVSPWRLSELVWPNVTGQAFPTNRRWLSVFKAEAHLWTSSLYVGILPLVLAASVWSLRRAATLPVRFASWLVLLGVLGSCGAYGLAWIVGLVAGGQQVLGVGSEVGGLYWLLNVLVPFYVVFRYPAKLFVIASLGIALLAARGWDAAMGGKTDRLRYGLFLLSVVSLVAWGLLLCIWPKIEARGAEMKPVPIFGPFDWDGARRDASLALLHTAAVCEVLLALFWLAAARPRWRPSIAVGLLLVAALDLAIAQRNLVPFAPAEFLRDAPAIVRQLPPDRENYRVFRQQGPLPPSWKKTASSERVAEIVRFDHETLWPKYPLPYHVAQAEASQTIVSEDYRLLLDVARTHHGRGAKSPLVAPSVLDLLAVRVAIVDPSASGEIDNPRPLAEGLIWGTRPTALPRAWIVHEAEVVPVVSRRSSAELRRFTEHVLFPDNAPRDWRRQAVVETNAPLELSAPTAEQAARESCRLVAAEPSRVELEVALETPGLVVLGDLFFPGWELTIESNGKASVGEVLRTNRVMRGAALGAGRHRLIYEYRPRSVWWGIGISGIAAIAIAIVAVVIRKQQRHI